MNCCCGDSKKNINKNDYKILAVLACSKYLPYEWRFIEYSDGKKEIQFCCDYCGWIPDFEPLSFSIEEIEDAIKNFDCKYTIALIL